MLGHRGFRGALDALRVAGATLLPLRKRPALRQVAVDRIVRRGLVGDDVGFDTAAHQFGQDLGRIAEEPDRDGLALFGRALDDRQRIVEVLGGDVEVAGAQRHSMRRGLAFDGQHRGAGHGRSERLRPAHAAQSGGQDPLAGKIAAEMLAAHLDESLVGALNDALRADIDPRARGHLAVHHQALAIELVEMVPGRPVRHEVRVGDQHPRRVRRGCGTRRPACPTAPAGSRRLRADGGSDDAVEASQSRAARPMPP